MREKSKGFTLIELLIVAVVIVVLSAILLTNFERIKSRSRDSKRVGDLNLISQSLEIYKQQNGTYPTDLPGLDTSTGNGANHSQPGGTDWAAGGLSQISPSSIDQLPKDPLNDSNGHWYYYEPTNKTQTQFGVTCPTTICAYIVSAELENSSDSRADPGCESYEPDQNYCLSGGGAKFHSS